MILKTKSIVPT